MAISTSGLILAKERQSILDKLTQQTEELQDTPMWQTIGGIALPILAPQSIKCTFFIFLTDLLT